MVATMENPTCPFCKLRPSSDRVIHESRHHYIIASRYAMGLPGYVLLVSKEHLSCFGAPESSLEELDDFEETRHELLDVLTEEFGKEVIFFEHGLTGQTVNHAHMHFLPLGRECFTKFRDALKNWNEGFSDLKQTEAGFGLRMSCQDAVISGGGYLAIGCGNEALIVYCNDPGNVEKGLLRRALARACDLNEDLADWRKNATPDPEDESLVKETAERLRKRWAMKPKN